MLVDWLRAFHTKVKRTLGRPAQSNGSILDDMVLGAVYGASGVVCLGLLLRGAGVRRYATVDDLSRRLFSKQQTLRGVVTSVGDGDNFRFYHVPWFLTWRRIPSDRSC